MLVTYQLQVSVSTCTCTVLTTKNDSNMCSSNNVQQQQQQQQHKQQQHKDLNYYGILYGRWKINQQNPQPIPRKLSIEKRRRRNRFLKNGKLWEHHQFVKKIFEALFLEPSCNCLTTLVCHRKKTEIIT